MNQDGQEDKKPSNGDVWVRRCLAITKLVSAIAPIIIVLYSTCTV